MATRPVRMQPKGEAKKPQIVEKPKIYDWSKPQALAIPKEGYFSLEQGRYGPVFPRTPACYGFSVLAKVNPGREQAMRDYGRNIEEAVKADPFVLKPLKLHYLRWILLDVGSGLHFMYQAFSTPISINISRTRSSSLITPASPRFSQTSKAGRKTGGQMCQRS